MMISFKPTTIHYLYIVFLISVVIILIIVVSIVIAVADQSPMCKTGPRCKVPLLLVLLPHSVTPWTDLRLHIMLLSNITSNVTSNCQTVTSSNRTGMIVTVPMVYRVGAVTVILGMPGPGGLTGRVTCTKTGNLVTNLSNTTDATESE